MKSLHTNQKGPIQRLRQRLTAANPPLKKMIEEFLDYEVGVKGLSENTVLNYGQRLAGFLKHCQKENVFKVQQIRPQLIYSFLRQLSDKADSTKYAATVAIRELIKYLILTSKPKKYLTKIAQIPSPKVGKKVPLVLSIEQINKLLEEPRHNDTYYFRDQAILELLYATGIRASELTNLKDSDLNFSEGQLKCLGKGSKERLIPVGRIAQQKLERYLQIKRYEQRSGCLADCPDGDYVFLSRSGARLHRRNILLLVKKYAGRAGLPAGVTVHTLRHCFATHLLARGADLRSIQLFLGHESIATTQIYLTVNMSQLKKTYQMFHPRSR